MTSSLLPQLAAPRPFLADGGLETDLIFHYGIDLPAFAAFVLLDSSEGRDALRRYFRPYLDLAVEHDTGIVLETPTWRANPDWGAVVGYDAAALDRINRDAVDFLQRLCDEVPEAAAVVSGCVGPRGDGYVVGERMSADEAASYHRPQIASLAGAGAACVSALTLTYTDEAVGFARAAVDVGVPCVVAFTVETDGHLPSGENLAEAILSTDGATASAPAYYMINCAHPSHFANVIEGPWTERVRGVRANASTCSHAELDEAEELDEGDPQALAADYKELAKRLPHLAVAGGCCGTDTRHVAAIAAALLSD